MKHTTLKVLTYMFVFLKLAGFIDWNWFFVVSPYLLLIGVDSLPFINKKLEEMANKKRQKIYDKRNKPGI